MKGILVSKFGDAGVLEYTELPLPEPAAGEVRVRLRATGVNPVDTYIRTGTYAMERPSLPYTPGTDGAGIVDKVGPNVTRLAVGDRVFVAAVVAKRNTGSYAETVVCDAEAVQPLPEALSFAQGAGLGTPALAASQALFQRARLCPGETVLVHGASGGVGTLAVQLACRKGATVIGTAGSNEGLAMLKSLGAHAALNHRQPGYLKEVDSITGGKGVQVVVEMLANLNLAKDMQILTKRGRVVVVGSRGPLEFDPRLVMTREACIYGMTLGNMSREEQAENMHALAAALRDGLRPIIGAQLPLAQAALAHRQIIDKNASRGKLVLQID